MRVRHLFALGIVLAGLLLAGLPRALALDPDRRISQYGHTVWRIQDGAISPPTNIAQTTDGFLWVTTAQGLMRFDGVRFTPWQPPHGQNLPGTHFSAVLGSRDGSLWIGTTRGLARWKDGQLRTYTDLEHYAGISAIMEDDSGTIWVTRYGLNAREAPLCSISLETLRCFGKKEGIPVAYGLDMTHDSEGNIWFGSSVLVRWRPGTPATTYFAEIAALPKGDGVLEVALGPSGTAWATIDGTGPQLGVRYYSGGKWTSYAVPGFDGARVRSQALLVDRRGSLWIGSENNGVYRISGGVADHYDVSDGLSGNSVGSLFEDREGNIWATTDGGLDMFRDTALISYTTRQGVSNSDFHSVMALRNGAVWIGTGDALNILRKQGGKTAIFDRRLSGKGVMPMLEDHSGVVWLGVDLALMRFQNGRFEEIGGQRFASFGGVASISEDSGGTIWVLTDSKNQLFSIVGDKIEKQASLNYELGWQHFLVADPKGGLWLGTQKGKSTISYFRDGRLQTTSLSSSQGPAGIHPPFVDSDGSLLVPSSQGLYRLNHGQLTLFGSDNGLPCPEIFNAIRDYHGALWIYTRCGMVRIAESEWAKWIENPHGAVSVMTLDALDGAQAGTGLSSQPTSSKGPDGRLWFVTGVSVQVLDPDHLYENALPPPVHIEDVIADRKTYSPQSGLRLPALTRDLEIDYTALSFVAPQKVHFQYKLEGYDRDWQDAGTRRQAFYSNLTPRNYTFRVKACNNSGLWNEAGAALNFNIAPAYYQTKWFLALCIAAASAGLYLVYFLRLKQATQRVRVTMEARVAERESIARDLHDTLLQSVQGLILKFHAVTKRIPDGEPVRQDMERALDYADQVLMEGRDRVRNLRTTGPLISDLPVAFREIADRTSHDRKVIVQTVVEGTPRELHAVVLEEVFAIGREALINALSHSAGQHVEVEITYDARQFRLRVRDDGRGIDSAILANGGRDNHWGLNGMRERASKIGGQLELWSRPGNGTEAALTVPAGSAYRAEPKSKKFWHRWSSGVDD